MINYEEELKKFHPSMDVNEAEDAIYSRDLTDVTDILKEMLKDEKKNRKQGNSLGVFTVIPLLLPSITAPAAAQISRSRSGSSGFPICCIMRGLKKRLSGIWREPLPV